MEPEAIERLKAYRWPGNVRELENLVKRLTALYAEESIGLAAVEMELATTASVPTQNARGSESLTEAVEKHLHTYFMRYGGELPPDGLYDRILKEIERPLVTLTLHATRGNQLKAAKVLGLNRNTLRKKIKDLDISVVRGMH